MEECQGEQTNHPANLEDDECSPPMKKKLRPVPRNAPRNIEKTGKFTIRKGVRIREYNVPRRRPGADPSPTSSPEFQCRDGFTQDETLTGCPQLAPKRVNTHNSATEYPRVLLDQLPLRPADRASQRENDIVRGHEEDGDGGCNLAELMDDRTSKSSQEYRPSGAPMDLKTVAGV